MVQNYNMLKHSRLQFLRKFQRKKLVFQLDNASCYKSDETKVFSYRKRLATLLSWSKANRESIGDDISRHLCENKQHDSIDDLKNVITTSWNSIAVNVLSNLNENIENFFFK